MKYCRMFILASVIFIITGCATTADTSPGIIQAAYPNNLNATTELLENGANVDDSLADGTTALMIASQGGWLPLVKLLLDNNADANAKTLYGTTALMFASRNGHTEIVNLLIKSGANIIVQRKDGLAAYDIAKKAGHNNIYKILVSNLNSTDNFVYATKSGHIEIIETLLKNDADSDSTDKNVAIGLIFASANGHIEIVEILLKHDANPNSTDSNGATSLIYASANGHREIVETLLKHGANPNSTDKNGATSIILASANGSSEVVATLLKYGANPNSMDKNGATSIILASANGSSEVVATLLKHGANPNSTDKNGGTSLIFASANGSSGVVATLLKHGANPNVRDKEGKGAVYYAAGNNHFENVSLLLQARADISTWPTKDSSPIQDMVLLGNHKIAKLFINAGEKAEIINDKPEINGPVFEVAGEYYLEHQDLINAKKHFAVAINMYEKMTKKYTSVADGASATTFFKGVGKILLLSVAAVAEQESAKIQGRQMAEISALKGSKTTGGYYRRLSAYKPIYTKAYSAAANVRTQKYYGWASTSSISDDSSEQREVTYRALALKAAEKTNEMKEIHECLKSIENENIGDCKVE